MEKEPRPKSFSAFAVQSYTKAERKQEEAIRAAQASAQPDDQIVVEDLKLVNRTDGNGQIWTGSVEVIPS